MSLLPLLAVHVLTARPGDQNLAPLTTVSTSASASAPINSRFELAAPLPTIPAITVDAYGNGVGLAQQMARSRNLQARILWIDATANIDRYNSEEKIMSLVRSIYLAGFNTVVFDIKPISGQVIYRSRWAPKLSEWRGKKLPAYFDPVPIMVRECKAHNLGIYASLNAFSEGHRMFGVGPGYSRLSQQTVLYETRNVVHSSHASFTVAQTEDRPSTDAVAVFTEPTKLPFNEPGSFAVTLRKDGTVQDGFEAGGTGRGVPTIPRGGVILYGKDDAAQFLRQNADPGSKLTFDTEPLFVPISERPEEQIPLMMNPNDPEVQDYALKIVREVVSTYHVDGIIYDDRFRYAGMNADFSPLTRGLFEKEVGKPLNWPDDVFKYTISQNLTRGLKPGPYYDRWMSWRADQLKAYLQKVRSLVKSVNMNAQVGLYAGSWYGEYPALGNNYASPELQAGFWFLTPQYAKTGIASMLDFLITGCYYPTATIYDAMSKGQSIGATVESAGMLSNRVVRDQTWVYAGIGLSDFEGDPEGLQNALQAACSSTQGVMVFDLSHNIEPMWPVFTRAFSQNRTAPHKVPYLIEEIRRRRHQVDSLSPKEPAVIIAAGSTGTGQ